MNDAHILTHPAFNRPPVLHERRRGRMPRDIPTVKRARWERDNELWGLRRWAKEHGIEPVNGIYDYDKIRELKAQHEAPYDPAVDRQKLMNDLARLADHILGAAEILSRLTVPRS